MIVESILIWQTLPAPLSFQRQLDAFNARDLDALLAIYAEDAQMFEHPNKIAGQWYTFRERFTARFQEPNLHATLLSRTVAAVMANASIMRRLPVPFPKARSDSLIVIYGAE